MIGQVKIWSRSAVAANVLRLAAGGARSSFRAGRSLIGPLAARTEERMATGRAGEPTRSDAIVVHPEAQVEEGNREAVGDGGMGEIEHGKEA